MGDWVREGRDPIKNILMSRFLLRATKLMSMAPTERPCEVRGSAPPRGPESLPYTGPRLRSSLSGSVRLTPLPQQVVWVSLMWLSFEDIHLFCHLSVQSPAARRPRLPWLQEHCDQGPSGRQGSLSSSSRAVLTHPRLAFSASNTWPWAPSH